MGEDFARFLLFYTICSIFAWLSKAWGLGFLFPILSVQPADRVLAVEEESGCAPPPTRVGDSPSSLHAFTPCLTDSTTFAEADSGFSHVTYY